MRGRGDLVSRNGFGGLRRCVGCYMSRSSISAVVSFLAALSLLCGAAWAEGDCASCGEGDAFPGASAFLDSAGLPRDEFRVLVTWDERPRRRGDGLVTGYRVMPVDGGEIETFELLMNNRK